MKKLLITGARGFIGRNLREALRDKYELFAPPSSELDLRDYEAVARYIDANGVSSVIHACSTAENTLDSDLRMFFSLERVSRNLDKFIYFGSGAEFDKRFGITMAREENFGERVPADGYGFAKYIMTSHARLSANIYNVRLFGVFGRYEDWTYKFISNLCCKAVHDLPLSIRRECAFDYIYVKDLPAVAEWVLNGKPAYHDYNFVYGEPVKLTRLAEIVREVSGKDLEIVVINADGRNNDYTADNSRLRSECSAFMKTPLVEAIGELYEYYREHKGDIPFDVLVNTK